MIDEFPEYTLEGRLGLVFIHADWASAAIYCEDARHEVFYERFVKRLFPSAPDFLVVCLGGKSEIKKAARRKDANSPIPEIYIIDKDFDDIIGGINAYISDGVISLRHHSVECYLAQWDAILEVALEELHDRGKGRAQLMAKLKERVRFEFLLREILLEFTKHFCVARKNMVSVQTSKMSAEDLYLNANKSWPLPVTLGEYKTLLLSKCTMPKNEWLAQPGQLPSELARSLTAKEQPWGKLPNEAHIVGKHLLAGFLLYADEMLGTSLYDMPDTKLYTRLITHINVDSFGYLRAEISSRLPDFI